VVATWIGGNYNPTVGVFTITIDDYLVYTQVNNYGNVWSTKFYYEKRIDEYLGRNNFQNGYYKPNSVM
jgi:hypothetical protein